MLWEWLVCHEVSRTHNLSLTKNKRMLKLISRAELDADGLCWSSWKLRFVECRRLLQFNCTEIVIQSDFQLDQLSVSLGLAICWFSSCYANGMKKIERPQPSLQMDECNIRVDQSGAGLQNGIAEVCLYPPVARDLFWVAMDISFVYENASHSHGPM